VPEMQQSYPVLIECTEHRVVWVEADSPEEAAEFVQNDSEYISTVQPYDADWTAKAPANRWDWEDLYGYTGGAPNNDAHVQVHRVEMLRQERAAKRATCSAAGHPNIHTPMSDGRSWCPDCSAYLAPAEVGGAA
jgi:hypothetical protein